MNKLIVLLAVCLLISGCIEAGYKHNQYDRLTGKLVDSLEVNHRMLNVNENTGSAYIVLSDGTTILLVSNEVIADPNSGAVEVDMIRAVASFGASGVIDNWMSTPK